ncbi:MAG: PAS domain S-box protein [Myxococcales bacterium]|nr:PAS domain S-box protein [Myxococcales bacterium]
MVDVTAILPSMATAVALDTLLAVVFLLLYRGDRSATHLRTWSLAWGLSAFSHSGVVLRMALGTSVLVGLALASVTTVSASLTLLGTYRLLGRRMPPALWGLMAAGIVFAPIAELLGQPLVVVALPSLAAITFAYAMTGIAVLRLRPRGTGEWLAGVGLLTVAIHSLDFPIFARSPTIFPIGLAIFAVQQGVVGFGFMMMYYERARRGLAASEERLRHLFDNAVVGAFRCDEEGRFVDANLTLARMLGRDSAASLCGSERLDALFVDEEGRARLRALLASEGVIDGVDFRWRRQDRSILTVSLHVRQVAGRAGGVRIEGLARDVTDSRRLQRRLAESERLEAIGRLAGGVAHDFNNLLTVVMSNAAMLGEARLDADERAALDDIGEAARRGSELVRQLLAFRRAEVVVRERVDLAALAERTRRILVRSLGEGVRVAIEASAPIDVMASPVEIEQVVMNLVLNARDAMPTGGAIAVRIRRVAEVGALAASPSGAWALLEIEDEGEGMDEATRERAIEPFYSTKEAGTGLGLATVSGIAARLGGSVELDSSPGAGTRVRVYVPALDEAAPRSEAPSSEARASVP